MLSLQSYGAAPPRHARREAAGGWVSGPGNARAGRGRGNGRGKSVGAAPSRLRFLRGSGRTAQAREKERFFAGEHKAAWGKPDYLRRNAQKAPNYMRHQTRETRDSRSPSRKAARSRSGTPPGGEEQHSTNQGAGRTSRSVSPRPFLSSRRGGATGGSPLPPHKVPGIGFATQTPGFHREANWLKKMDSAWYRRLLEETVNSGLDFDELLHREKKQDLRRPADAVAGLKQAPKRQHPKEQTESLSQDVARDVLFPFVTKDNFGAVSMPGRSVGGEWRPAAQPARELVDPHLSEQDRLRMAYFAPKDSARAAEAMRKLDPGMSSPPVGPVTAGLLDQRFLPPHPTMVSHLPHYLSMYPPPMHLTDVLLSPTHLI